MNVDYVHLLREIYDQVVIDLCFFSVCIAVLFNSLLAILTHLQVLIAIICNKYNLYLS